MPDNTSAGDGSQSGSHPSAQPEPAARFQSYAEYLARLDRSPFQPRYRHDAEQLWLASFTEDGRYIKRYTCILRDYNNSTNLPPVDVEGIEPDTTVLSSSEFKTLLQTTDENVPYRIVIAATSLWVPSRMTEDVLGLGLDLEPEVFDYVKSTVEPSEYIPKDEFPLPWFRDAPALRIGSNVLCILEKTSERKSKTAIMFLRDDDLFELAPRNSLGATMFSSKRPSQVRERPNRDSYHPRYYRKSLVERYITEATESDNQYGPGNFLYVCLAALLELHLSTAPKSVFQSRSFDGHQGLMRRYHNNSLRGTTNKPIPVSDYPDMGWSRFRMELDHQRHTLRWMTRFFKRHLDYRNKDLQAAFKEIRERFKLRVQDLEQVELQLRDQLASKGIDKSIRMAEMSIRESKRVLLLTALAFIFLPISLASSVYGMNVQQINGTGHSLRAFLITAFAMCASAVVLWAFIAGFQSRRVRLKKRLESDHGVDVIWRWYDWLMLFSFFDTWESLLWDLKRWWFRYQTRSYLRR